MLNRKTSGYAKTKGERYILPSIFMCVYFCITGYYTVSMAANLKSEIIQNLAGVKKVEVSKDSIKDAKLYRMARSQEFGYSRDSGRNYFKEEGRPSSILHRLDDKGNIIWSKSSQGWPTNSMGAIFTYEGNLPPIK